QPAPASAQVLFLNRHRRALGERSHRADTSEDHPPVAPGMSRSSPDRRRARRARLTVDDIDQQQSLRGLAALSEKEWAEYLLVRYPMSVAFDWIGIPRPAEQRLSAEAEARIRRALGNDRGA